MLIIVAGPYRSGTGDDPLKLDANVKAMEAYALPILRAGHFPIVGEWAAVPLAALAGSTAISDAAFKEITGLVDERMVACCDAVLRIGGASSGADQIVAAVRAQGKPVYYRLEDIPGCG
jgi:hypothetical protein